MPNILDVFSGDGYTCSELTAAIQKAPYIPGRLGKKGLFGSKGVTTTSVQIERKAGKIALIPTKTRGSGETTKRSAEKRDLRSFSIPHIPYSDTLLADSVQNIRAFGQGDRLEAINTVLNEKIAGLRQDHEITHEYHRIGAIQGIVLDADGSTEIFDLFDEFGIVETEVDFALDTEGTNVKAKCDEVLRAIESALGGVPFNGVEAQVGDDFWDMLIAHASVEAAYDRWQDGEFFRTQQRVQEQGQWVRRFEFGQIVFENYRGQVGNVPFIPTDTARFYPVGIPDLFVAYYAPADYMETVNTIGQPVYVKQERMKFDKGIELDTQSNPAHLCTRPEVLIKGTTDVPT